MSQAPNGVPNVLWKQMPEQYRNMMSVLQEEDGIAKVMLQNTYGTDPEGEATTSQAEIVADMFNIMRLDVKALGEATGVDIGVSRMTPERAAELLQGLVRGEDLALLDKFNALEEKRERILLELTDQETVDEHQELKQSILYSEAGEAESDTEIEEDEPPDETAELPEEVDGDVDD